MTEQITREEGKHVTKEGSSAGRLHSRQFIFVSMGCCTGLFSLLGHIFKKFWINYLFLTPELYFCDLIFKVTTKANLLGLASFLSQDYC